MRVLLVNDWTPTGGGVERYVRDVLTGLRDAGDDVRLLAADVGDAPTVADELVETSDSRGAQAFLQVVNPFAVRRARRLTRRFDPDVAYVSMFEMRLSPAVVAALRPVPVVLNVAYYKPICPTGLKLLPGDRVCTVRAGRVCVRSGCVGNAHWLRDAPRYALIRRAVRGATDVVTCSEHMRACLAREGIGAGYAPWPTAPPPASPGRAPSQDPLLVYVGRLAREKGVLELVRAFEAAAADVGGARLEILGDGPLRQQTEAEIRARGLGGRVALHGWAGQEELEASLSQAWAVVVPSLWEEPLGLVALEAVVRGVPVVATAAGGLVELVEHGRTGLLVPPGAPGELAAALTEILTGRAFPDHRADAATAASLASRHDPAAHIAWLRSVFERVAA
jgi:glycosyltransferase involved in cell wall biosynthesis